MHTTNVSIEIGAQPGKYDISIGHAPREQAGSWARECVGSSVAKLMIVSNPTVYAIYGDQVNAALATAGFEVRVHLIGDGEQYKTLEQAAGTLAAFTEFGLSRTDAVLALGGGVVGDLAGFAASIYLRGVAFLQMPTTLLSMIDSSVGGKTGVNSEAGKNRIGTFYQPNGVLIDTDVLRTLPARELTAGFCEAIKHGALGGQTMLGQLSQFLEKYSGEQIAQCFEKVGPKTELAALIQSQVEFKASIVRNDERESAGRSDGHSRKILNFGHTLAHALEKVTDYSYFRHGEAVGYGIIFAAEISKKLDLLDPEVVDLLYGVVHQAGTLPTLNDIDAKEVFEAFRFDKKIVGGSLQLILLKGLGKPYIVDAASIPHSTFLSTLTDLLRKGTDQA